MAKGAEIPKLGNSNEQGIALTPVGTLTGAGANPVFQDYSYLQNVGFTEGAPRRFDIAPYENIIGKGRVNPNLDTTALDELRAKSQSTGRLIGSAIGQTATTILGGAITGLGSLLNFGEATWWAVNSIWNENAKYKWDDIINKGFLGSGELIKIGKDLEEFGRTSMPIYQTQQAQKGGFSGGMGDATWWASMFPTVGSAVASMVPMIGSMKALQMAGKLGMIFNGVSKAGRVANKVGKFLYKPATQQTFGTLFGAHLDSMEEIVRGYDEQFQYAKDLGFSEDEARRFASVYAAKAYNDAWAMGVVFNGIELNALLRGIKKAPINSAKVEKGLLANIRGLARQGKNYVIDSDAPKLTKAVIAKEALNKFANFAKISLSEGLEEMRVDVALNEGILEAKKELGISDVNENSTFFHRLAQFAGQGKSWDSFIWGAIGGGVMAGGRGLINKVLNGKKIQEFDQRRATTILNGITDITNTIADFDGDMQMSITSEQELDKDGQPIVNEDGSIKTKYKINDPAADLMVSIMNTVGKTNGFEYATEFFKEVSQLSNEELTEIYGEGKRPIVDAISREFNIMRDIYGRNMGLTWGNPFDDVLRIQASTEDYLKDYYTRQKGIIETDIALLNDEPQNRRNEINERLKTIDKTLYDIYEARNKYNNLKFNYEVDIDDLSDNITKTSKSLSSLKGRKTKLTNKIADNENKIKTLKSEIKVLNDKIAVDSYDNLQLDLFDKDVYNKAKQEVDSKYTQIEDLYKQNRDLTKKLDEVEFNISAANEQINDSNNKIEATKKLIDKADAELKTLDDKYNAIAERENNNIAEFNRVKDELRDIKFNNEKYQSLSILLNQLTAALDILNDRIVNRDVLMPLKGKMLEKLQEESDKFEEKAEKDDVDLKTNIEANTTEQESQPEPIVKSDTDSGGISYSLDASDKVNSVSFNDKVYSVGSKFNLAGSPKTIQELNLLQDEDLDFIQVVIKDDETGEETESFAKDLANADIQDYIPPKPKAEKTIFDTLKEITTNNDKNILAFTFHKALDVLSKASSDVKNDYYKALFAPSNDSDVIENRNFYIGKIIIFLDENTPTEISDDTIKLKTDIITKLNNILLRNARTNKLKKLVELFSKSNPKSSIALTDAQRSSISEMFSSINEEIAILLDDKITLKDNNIEFTTSDIDFNEIKDFITNKVNSAINSKDEVIQKYLNDEKLSYINEIILELKNLVKPKFINKLQVYRSIKDRSRNKVNNLLAKSNSDDKHILNTYPEVKEKIKDVLELDEIVSSLYETVVTKHSVPTIEDVNKYSNQRAKVESWIGKSINEIGISNPQLASVLEQSEITVLLNTPVTIANDIIKFYGIEPIDETISEPTILGSLNEFIELASEDFTTSVPDTLAYKKNEVNYYISDNVMRGLQAIWNFINELNAKNIYSESHRYTFDDILDVIYQQPEGRELVLDSYTNIWNALMYFKNDINSAAILSQMALGHVDEDEIRRISKIFDAVQKQIINPRKSTDPKYIDNNYNLKNNYIQNFFKTHIQNEYDFESRSGLRRITPTLYDELFSETNYDKKFGRVKNIVTINGVKFKATELFDIIQNIQDGQTFKAIKVDEEIHIVLNIGDKQLLIEKINPKDSDTYGGFPLGRLTLNNELVYNSAFGSENGLSSMAGIVAKYITRTDVFDKFKEFYKIGYKANLKNKFGDESVKEKLYAILKDIDKIHFADENGHNEIINAIFKAIAYNTNEEISLTPESLPIESLDLQKAYKFIAPAFYGYRLENIDDMPRSMQNVYNRYINLNNKLAKDFKETQELNKDFETKSEVDLVLNHFNKSPLMYASSRNFQGRLGDNITSVQGLIPIIIQQLGADHTYSISDLSTGSAVENEYIKQEINRQETKGQLFTYVKANNNKNGVSVIPIRRGNSNSGLNSEYDKAAIYGITQQLIKLAERASLTFNSPRQNSNIEFIENDDVRKRINDEYDGIIDYLSDIIITDNIRNSIDPNWFNVSPLYKRANNYAKRISFTTSTRGQNTVRTGVPYTNTIEIVYDKIGDRFVPKWINAFHAQIPAKRKIVNNKLVLGKQKSLLTASEIKLLKGELKPANQQHEEYVTIPINDKQTISAIFNSDAFQKLFGNTLRSITTKYNTNHYEFGVKRKNKFESVSGSFTPQYLQDARNKGIISSSTPITFDNLYQFHLVTNSLTTTLRVLKDKDGNKLYNYGIADVPSAMFFERKKVNNEAPKEIQTIDDKHNIINILKEIAGPRTYVGKNWFKTLLFEYKTTEQALRAIGIITDETSKSDADALISLYDTIYENADADISVKSFSEDRKKYNGYVSRIPSGTRILNLNLDYLNSSATHINDIRDLINHESLHIFFGFEDNYVELQNKLNEIVSPVIDDFDSLSLEEFNKKYKCEFTDDELINLKIGFDIIKNQPREIPTLIFTNNKFAPLANRIVIEDNTNKTKNTLWNKILNGLLDLLGIKIKKGSLTYNVRNAIVNELYNGNNIDNNSASGRLTLSPTGRRSEATRPSNQESSQDSALDEIAKIGNSIDNSDSLVNDWYNNTDNFTLPQLDFDTLRNSLLTADRGMGGMPTAPLIQNSLVDILKIDKNDVSLTNKYKLDFLDKYTDDNNNKIC